MENRQIRLKHTAVGDGRPCSLVAEIGLNHNGNAATAHELVEAAAKAGANLVKFQKRSPADLATEAFLDAPFPKCPQLGQTQREVRTRLELSLDEFRELRSHSDELGLTFSISVFDLPSLETALELEVEMLKLASHSITNSRLLQEAASTGIPLVVSMGAASWEERDKAFEMLEKSPLVLLHCISSYPCPDEIIKLDTMTELRQRYGQLVGYSGHETGTDVSLAASVLGACMVERHFTLDRSMVGLDHALSLEPGEFADLERRIRRLEKARGITAGIAEEEMAARQNYHVAICASRLIQPGEVILASDLVCKQPLGEPGLSFSGLELDHVIGKRPLTALGPDQPIPRTAIQ